MTSKAKLGAGNITIEGERYSTDTFEYDGVVTVMRELSVDEGDAIWDAAQEPDPKDKTATRTNNRLNSRMLLSKSLVEPSVTVDQVGKWGGKKYVTFMRHFDGLNTVSEPNPTLPGGSPEPTSPSGGESSPAI